MPMAEYIERSEALRKSTAMTEYDEGGWGAKVLVVRAEDIEKLPATDVVEVVRGQWEDAYEITSFRYTNIPAVKCSVCGCYFCDIINNHHFMYHYCPNCGARMDGGADG